MKIFVLMAAALVLPLAAAAQERTAGQANDAQVNWAALRNSLDMVSSQNKALAATITKMQACNQKKKIYAPEDSAADADGCVGGGLALGQELPAAPPVPTYTNGRWLSARARSPGARETAWSLSIPAAAGDRAVAGALQPILFHGRMTARNFPRAANRA